MTQMCFVTCRSETILGDNSEPAGRSSIGYTRDFCFYYGPDIIHHIPIQNQWWRPQNYPECQPSGAAILNARNQY